jgi:hypothetical protein
MVLEEGHAVPSRFYLVATDLKLTVVAQAGASLLQLFCLEWRPTHFDIEALCAVNESRRTTSRSPVAERWVLGLASEVDQECTPGRGWGLLFTVPKLRPRDDSGRNRTSPNLTPADLQVDVSRNKAGV